VKGSFTGAAQDKAGLVEHAHGGTLFLDEIGELPKELQPKLLRALEKREVKRLGGRQGQAVDVRVIAATNRNLTAEVRAGNFRQDLYYRIAAARVFVPPLRERLEDLPMLIDHFLKLDAPTLTRASIAPHIWEMLSAHRWPGNVRELRNAVQRLVVAPELALHESDIAGNGAALNVPSPAQGQEPEPLRVARRTAADAFERAYLRGLLQRTQNNVSRAAAIAEVSRQMIQKLMRKHGMTERE
jgi:transcriptional regulator with PAS, ATPase and Fis domain